MERLIFAVDGMTKAERRQGLTYLYAASSSCRLKSPLALSGKNFLSTKVTRGARRDKKLRHQEMCLRTKSHADKWNTAPSLQPYAFYP